MLNRLLAAASLLLLSGFLPACGSQPLGEPDRTPTATTSASLTATPTSRPTRTITPTTTASFTPSPTPSDTPTPTFNPNPTVLIDGGSLFLWVGPDTTFEATQVMESTVATILGKKESNNLFYKSWYKVRLESTGQEGWVPVPLFSYAFDERGVQELTDYAIPATPTPSLTPVLPLTVAITVVNQLDQELEAFFNGPYQVTLKIPAGSSRTAQLPAGDYYYYLSSSGYVGKNGNGLWEAGFSDTWYITWK